MQAKSIPLEVKKDGLSQLQDGSWVLKLKVHPEDMHTALLQAPMGTRYMCAIVELADDETPKPHAEHRRSQQAALLCEDPRFRRFLLERYGSRESNQIRDKEHAAKWVRQICDVDSRSKLDGIAAEKWDTLKGQYEVWLKS